MFNEVKRLLCFGFIFIVFLTPIVYSGENLNQITVNLGNNSQEKDLHVLSQNPSKSIPLLINELHVINENQIVPTEVQQKIHSLHVIWCIRALRYVTGEDFKAPTQYSFGDVEFEKNRKYWLSIKDNRELPFFSVWMSRDIVYVAPKDVQAAIIEKWKEWYNSNDKQIKPNIDINFWYF